MGLEDLNNQLYSRDEADSRAKTENQFEPDLDNNLAKQNIQNLTVDDTHWQPIHHEKTWSEKLAFWWAEHQRKIYIGGGVFVFLAVAGGLGWYAFQQFFSEKNTSLVFTVEERVKSGEAVTPKIIVRSENSTALENVKVFVDLPDGFVADVPLNGWKLDGRRAEKEIGVLTKDQQVEVSLPGKIFGNKGVVANFKATVEYSPAKISGVYAASAEAKTLILSSPLTLEVKAPQELVTGQELNYEVTYKNESNETFDNVRIRATFPEGFTFKSADPPTNARDIWFVSTFRPGDSGKIVVQGTLEGVWDEQKQVHFALGYESGAGEFIAYNEGSTTTKMIASPLSIKHSLSEGSGNSATPGQILSYNIQYQNNSSQGYREAVVAVTFENPEFLDWENLDLPQGSYDQNTRTITWRAGEVPELRALAPGATGNLNFSIPVIADFSNLGIVKNKAVVSRATIDSPDIQSTLAQNKLIGSNTISVPLGTLVGFQAYAYHNDTALETDGPLPPEAGKKTEYVLRFRVTNPANDVTGGKVVVLLPGYMRFTSKKSPEDAIVTFNDRTNEATWSLGSMSPGSSREVRIQTEFSPGDNLIGKEFLMLQSATFSGTDAFTKQPISLSLERKFNNLSDDPNDLPANYNIVKK